MLTELQKFDSLGGKNELLFMLFKALPLSENQTVSELKRFCTSNHFTIGRSLEGMVRLLEFITVIKIKNNVVTINKDRFNPTLINDYQNYFNCEDFYELLFSSLDRESCLTSFIRPDALKFDYRDQTYYVKENLIPTKFISFRNLLFSIGFFKPNHSLDSNNLIINPKFSMFLERIYINKIKSQFEQIKKKKTLSDLKAQLILLETYGKEAEFYVMEFEKRRLQDHPNKKSIQRISDEHINAGYDIESYNNNDSVFIDRYIEVKSFSGELSFHWSKNEIEKAKEYEDNYFLYFVDRNKIKYSNYSPKIIQNPYQLIYNNNLWIKEPESWIFKIV